MAPRFLTSDELDHLACGALAGGVARLFVAPLDLIKIRFQIQDARAAPLYSGIVQSMRTIFRTEGLSAFWKGNLPAELMVAPYVAVQFSIFHLYQRHILQYFPDLNSSLSNLTGGCLAGIIATVSVYPFDLLRTRMAAQHVGRATLRPLLVDAWNSAGVQGLYRGLWPTLVGIAPYSALQFGIYGLMIGIGERFVDGSSSFNMAAVHFWSGFLAGLGSKTLTMPFDVIKKRTQVEGYNWRPEPISELRQVGTQHRCTGGVLQCARSIVQNEGWRALYKGLSPSLLKAAPNSAITFVVFEFSRKFLKQFRGAS